MDEDRRAALKARRDALRDRLALAPINDLAGRLAERGCRAEILMPQENERALGELIGVPGKGERIDWNRVPTARVRLWTDDAMRDALAVEAVHACAGADAYVAVMWNPLDPGIAVRVEEIGGCIDLLLGAAPETWIVGAEGGPWLIECALFDREVCWSTDLMQGIGQRP